MKSQTRVIYRETKAGLDDRGDVVVCLSPAEKGTGVQLEIESRVMSMFGDQIRASVLDVIENYELTDLKVQVHDRGALDYVIRARLTTAIERAMKEG
jgi:citrate lyase subunit gamma (acyl carrier protein)